MAITIGEAFTPGHPVVKRSAIGERFVGAVVNTKRRERQRRADDGSMVPMLKADGKPRMELVVTCVTMPDTTATAGIKDEISVPEPGDVVRLILKGKSFADWIQAENGLGRQLQVGDKVTQLTDSAQVYDADGNPKGPQLTDQADVDKVPRTATVGIYAKLKLEPGDGEWIDKAEDAYRAENATVLPSTTPQVDEEPW